MDPISQGVVGAVFAQAVVRTRGTAEEVRREVRWATLAGVASGMAADLDVLIRSAEDPLLSLEFHRHFTHSLLFVPVGAFLVAIALWPWARRRVGFWKWILWCLVGFATAAPLDACTSYGTRLLWPFSDQRVAWDVIAIIDPVFTLTGLWLAIRTFRRGRPSPSRWAVGILLAYLSFGWLQRDRAHEALMARALERGHGVERCVVRPTIGNLLLWRGTYVWEGRIHADAVRVGFLESGVRVYDGESAPLLMLEDLALPPGSVVEEDVRRFAHFSDHWLVRHPDDSEVIGDGRYSVGADEIRPIWGIRPDLERPSRHVEYLTFHRVSREQWRRFWAMLRGN